MVIRYPDLPEPPRRPEPERPWPGYPSPPPPPVPPPATPPPLPGAVRHLAPAGGFDPVLDRLLDERIVYLGGELEDAVPRLLLLGALDPRRDITLYVHTPGGSAAAGVAVHDTLRSVGPDVATRAVGLVGLVGSLLLAAGTPGKRHALPHARILLRAPSVGQAGGHPGAGPEPAERAEIARQLRQEMIELLARYTGRPPAAIEADVSAARRLTATEAVEYGLVDGVING